MHIYNNDHISFLVSILTTIPLAKSKDDLLSKSYYIIGLVIIIIDRVSVVTTLSDI